MNIDPLLDSILGWILFIVAIAFLIFISMSAGYFYAYFFGV